MKNSSIDLDCWEYHLGFVYGAARALGATIEVIKSIDWMRDQIQVGDEETNLDRMLREATTPKPTKRIKAQDDFETPTRIKTTEPYKGANEPGLSSLPMKRQKGEWSGSDFKDTKKPKEKGSASEPPSNSLGIPEWGIEADYQSGNHDEQTAELPLPSETVKKRSGYTSEEEADIIRWAIDGKSPAYISKETGRGYQAVYAKVQSLRSQGKLSP